MCTHVCMYVHMYECMYVQSLKLTCVHMNRQTFRLTDIHDVIRDVEGKKERKKERKKNTWGNGKMKMRVYSTDE